MAKKKKKVTPKNLKQVFDKILNLCADQNWAAQFCKDFDKMLDEQVTQDFYGTEAQCDPRGDQRD